MPHLDPDDLAVISLDASHATPEQLDHLDGCPACTEEVNSFRATASRLGGLFGDHPEHPSEHTWDRIAAELDNELELAAAQTPERATGTAVLTGVAAGDPAPDDAPGTDRPVVTPLPAPSPPVDTSFPVTASRLFLQRAALPLAAAVAGLLIGGGVVGWWMSGPDAADPKAAPSVLAVSPLGPVDGDAGSGTNGRFGRAELIGTDTGTALQVNAADLPTVTGDYQVWLLGDADRMVSLGVLHDGTGTFAVPNNLDLARYRIVDISDEPDDGNPLHSGLSIARGELP